MHLRKTVLLGALVALALPTASLADTKTVTESAKKASFTGTITDATFGLYDLALFFNGSTEVRGNSVCVDPQCHEHTLTVGPNGVELALDATSDASNLSLDIIDPDGSMTSINEVDPTADHSLDFAATEGDWTIRVYGGSSDFDYKLDATFKTQEDVDAETPPEEPEE